MSTRLWRFQFSTAKTFAIEVGGLYFRFYTDHGQVQSGGNPYEVAHPYAAEDVANLYFKQINDVIYITHPDYPVGKLSRVSDASWTYEVVAFDTVATLDENVTETTITADGATGSVNLEASSAIFDPLHVDSFWRIGYKRPSGLLEVFINANIDSNGYVIFGTYNVRTYGTWAADVVLEKKNHAGEWEEVQRWRGNLDRNIDVESEATEPVEYRLRVQNYESHSDVARVVLEWRDAIIYGTVQIDSVGSDGTTATATVTEDLYSEPGWTQEDHATIYWQEGAWSDYRGYPRAVALHEQRLVFGGTAFNPATLWGSVVGDFENFLRGSADDASWAFQLAAEELNAIQWIESLDVLAIGTSGGEWRGRGDELGGSITPTRFDFKQKTFFGSAYRRAVKVADSTVLFIERGSRKIRELHIAGDTFETADLTLLSENVTASGADHLAWQADQRILWMVNGDGELWGLTYDREQQVAGWHGPHTTAGTYHAVCCLYGIPPAFDEVWVIVERAQGSGTVLRVEYFDPADWENLEDAFFVDSGLSYDGSPVSELSGLEHLAGLDIVGLADGVAFEATVDESGAFTLPSAIGAASKVHAGLAFTSELSPFRLDVDAGIGPFPGKVRTIDRLHARLYRSAGGSYKKPEDTDETAKPIEYQRENGTGALKNGDVQLGYKAGHAYDPTIIVRQSDPYPMTVQALIVGLEVSST